MHLYRARASIAFLSCRAALQPIFPRSQCWRADTDNNFILQIRPLQYWRIELSVNADTTDYENPSYFRRILEETLLFEKTPCPFRESTLVTEHQMMPGPRLNNSTCQSFTTGSKRPHADIKTQRRHSVSDETPTRMGSPKQSSDCPADDDLPFYSVGCHSRRKVAIRFESPSAMTGANQNQRVLGHDTQHQGSRKCTAVRYYYRQIIVLASIVLLLCAMFVKAILLFLELCVIAWWQIIGQFLPWRRRKKQAKLNSNINKQR